MNLANPESVNVGGDFIRLGHEFVFSPAFKTRILKMIELHSDLLNTYDQHLFENEPRHL